MGMRINHWEWEGMGLKKIFPLISTLQPSSVLSSLLHSVSEYAAPLSCLTLMPAPNQMQMPGRQREPAREYVSTLNDHNITSDSRRAGCHGCVRTDGFVTERPLDRRRSESLRRQICSRSCSGFTARFYCASLFSVLRRVFYFQLTDLHFRFNLAL